MQHALDLPGILKQGRLFEEVERDASIIEQESSQSSDKQEAHAVRQGSSPFQPRQYKQNKKTEPGTSKKPLENKECYNCGRSWPHSGGRSSCPARGKKCNACHRLGHFASLCRSTHKTVRAVNPDSSLDSEEHVCTTYAHTQAATAPPRVVIEVNGVPIRFMIDTGAAVSMISSNSLQGRLSRDQLSKTSMKVFAYGAKSPLSLLGQLNVVRTYNGSSSHETLYVVSGECSSLLSFSAASRLGLVQITYSVEEGVNRLTPSEVYPDLFKGVGCLKDFQVHLHVDPQVQPVAQPHRRIPFSMRKPVEEELERLQSLDIIEKAEGPTPWVSPVVLVPKPHDPEHIRMCVDMRCANRAIQRERHVTPTVDDILAALNGSVMFSKLDLKDGYHQLELDEASRVITTFSTHAGLFRYKRLNFGVTSAAEVFQDTVRQVLNNIPNVLNVSDDILVFGKSEKEHNDALRATLERLHASGLTLNVSKCKFYQQELIFFGHVFSNKGVQPDPQKVSTILKASPPANASEVKSLLGLVNYCGRFIPNLADIAQPLRKLTAKGEVWDWTDKHQDALEKLKGKLSAATALAYFDPEKAVTLIVDAAPHGLGAILTQASEGDTKVIAYGSRTLSPVEARYSQIEREMLAVVWGIEHFHIYLYGTKFHLLTDHKPLVSIIGNPHSLPSARLERLALRIQQYTFDVQHTSGSSNPSDYLSRHPVSCKEKFRRMESAAEEYVNFVVSHSLPCAMTIEEVTKATQGDPELSLLKKTLNQGQLGTSWKKTPIQQFSRVAPELSVSEEGLVLRGTRIVLPASLHRKAVQLAHRGHQGIVKTKQLMREKVWFPGMDSLVHKEVKSCQACQANTPVHHRDPLPILQQPRGPWKELSIDFAGPFPDGKYAMVVVDDFSKYPVVSILHTLAAPTVIRHLRIIFAQFGSPDVLKSDNGSPFQSDCFAGFAAEFGFKHHRVTPRWPEANGEAERFMRTLKKSILASSVSHQEWTVELQTFLLAYRSTPHGSTGKPPFDLLFGRPMQNYLPTFPVDAPPSPAHTDAQQCDARRKAYNKWYVDTRRRTKSNQFRVGQQVLRKQEKRNKFSPYYDPNPYTITKITGSQVTASRNGKTTCRNSSFFKDASTVQAGHYEDQTSIPGIDDEIVPRQAVPSQAVPSQAVPNQAVPNIPRTSTSQRYPQRTRQQPGHLKDFVCG